MEINSANLLEMAKKIKCSYSGNVVKSGEAKLEHIRLPRQTYNPVDPKDIKELIAATERFIEKHPTHPNIIEVKNKLANLRGLLK